MTNSRDKGKRGELEVAKILKERGYDAHRSVQYCGANGDADVVGLDGAHIEVKRVEQLNIDKAMHQALRDAREDDIPVVFHRKNNELWKATSWLGNWLDLYEQSRALSTLLNSTDVDYVCCYMDKCGDWCKYAERDAIGDCTEDMAQCYVEYLKRRRTNENKKDV